MFDKRMSAHSSSVSSSKQTQGSPLCEKFTVASSGDVVGIRDGVQLVVIVVDAASSTWQCQQ